MSALRCEALAQARVVELVALVGRLKPVFVRRVAARNDDGLVERFLDAYGELYLGLRADRQPA